MQKRFAAWASATMRDAARDTCGSMMLIGALSLPVLTMGGFGAVEVAQAVSAHRTLQDAADSAALMGAQQLSFAPGGAEDRTKAFAQGELKAYNSLSNAQIQVTVVSGSTMKVAIQTVTPSLVNGLLPNIPVSATAAASAANQVPLCVLVFGDKHGNQIQVQQQSTMNAPACLVHSNSDINVDKSAQLTAAAVETGGKAKGFISPSAGTDAPAIADPFSQINIDFPSTCPGLSLLKPPKPDPLSGILATIAPGATNTTVISTSTVLPAGVHCDNIVVQNGATLTLAPGEHYFGGNLWVEDTSQLSGDDVVLDFALNSSFDFSGTSQVSLNGRRSGPLAGFVILANRQNTHPFNIESSHVSNLYGTVYIPAATLQVTGYNRVAQSSPWTVITALALQLQADKTGSPQLVINANYTGSVVPVPTGVGPRAGRVYLTQ